MNAYLFTAWVRRPAPPRLNPRPEASDSCRSLIIYGGTAEEAQARFEFLMQLPRENAPADVIEKVVGAQFVEGLFTENGNVPIDWPTVRKEAEKSVLEFTETDPFDQGYWADCNALVNPNNLSATVEALRQELPEDISSGLNWSADKQFFYVISVLKQPAWMQENGVSPPAMPDTSKDPIDQDPESDEIEMEPDTQQPATLELAQKEAAAFVRARNSVVAAWLWRKFAVGTQLSHHPILLDPWCGVRCVVDNPADYDEEANS
jgi:hypothetical protein